MPNAGALRRKASERRRSADNKKKGARLPRVYCPWLDFDTDGRDERKLDVRAPAWLVHALKSWNHKTSKTRMVQWAFEMGMGPLAARPEVTAICDIYRRPVMATYLGSLSDWNFRLSSQQGADSRVWFDKADKDAARKCHEVAEALGLRPSVVGGMAVLLALVGRRLPAEYVDLLRRELRTMVEQLGLRLVFVRGVLQRAQQQTRRPRGSVEWSDIE